MTLIHNTNYMDEVTNPEAYEDDDNAIHYDSDENVFVDKDGNEVTGMFEGMRIRKVLNDIFITPIDFEPAFYLALWRFIEGTDNQPSVHDYKEVDRSFYDNFCDETMCY